MRQSLIALLCVLIAPSAAHADRELSPPPSRGEPGLTVLQRSVDGHDEVVLAVPPEDQAGALQETVVADGRLLAVAPQRDALLLATMPADGVLEVVRVPFVAPTHRPPIEIFNRSSVVVTTSASQEPVIPIELGRQVGFIWQTRDARAEFVLFAAGGVPQIPAPIDFLAGGMPLPGLSDDVPLLARADSSDSPCQWVARWWREAGVLTWTNGVATVIQPVSRPDAVGDHAGESAAAAAEAGSESTSGLGPQAWLVAGPLGVSGAPRATPSKPVIPIGLEQIPGGAAALGFGFPVDNPDEPILGASMDLPQGACSAAELVLRFPVPSPDEPILGASMDLPQGRLFIWQAWDETGDRLEVHARRETEAGHGESQLVGHGRVLAGWSQGSSAFLLLAERLSGGNYEVVLHASAGDEYGPSEPIEPIDLPRRGIRPPIEPIDWQAVLSFVLPGQPWMDEASVFQEPVIPIPIPALDAGALPAPTESLELARPVPPLPPIDTERAPAGRADESNEPSDWLEVLRPLLPASTLPIDSCDGYVPGPIPVDPGSLHLRSDSLAPMPFPIGVIINPIEEPEGTQAALPNEPVDIFGRAFGSEAGPSVMLVWWSAPGELSSVEVTPDGPVLPVETRTHRGQAQRPKALLVQDRWMLVWPAEGLRVDWWQEGALESETLLTDGLLVAAMGGESTGTFAVLTAAGDLALETIDFGVILPHDILEPLGRSRTVLGPLGADELQNTASASELAGLAAAADLRVHELSESSTVLSWWTPEGVLNVVEIDADGPRLPVSRHASPGRSERPDGLLRRVLREIERR